MARYKDVVTQPRFLPIDLTRQLQPRTFEHALNHLLDQELDLSSLDARFCNDATGASANTHRRRCSRWCCSPIPAASSAAGQWRPPVASRWRSWR